jgi:class 3 adenylate cyclase
MDYDAVLAQVRDLLQREQRLSYRVLKRRLQLDDDVLEDLKEDLIYAKKLAVDEEGRVLVWTGGTSSAPPTASPVPLPAPPDVSPAQGEAAAVAPPTPEAERRQLTVLFCDLVEALVGFQGRGFAMASNSAFVILSSLKPLFSNSLTKELCFSDSAGA